MPNNNELRQALKTTLNEFETNSLRGASIGLLKTLGYQSDKTITVPKSDPQAFLEILAEHNPDVSINKEKSLFDDWKKADVLFQLTDEELSDQTSLFKDDSVNSGLLQSYLFFAIELKGRDYARGKLTAIARQLNRVFPMPVMVFIKHRDLLSIAVINRRLNKRDSEKDVLGKVTIIRDISLENPHRGHLDILNSFALPSMIAKTAIYNFDTLHAAWEEIFNVELLNKKFYKELSNWYFWAINEVSFPGEPTRQSFFGETGSTNDSKWQEAIQEHNAKNVIRLLTRFLFVWFIKEKQLIPDEFFDLNYLQKEMLNDLSPQHEKDLFSKPNIESHYYKAILQNLFFATLNQEMGKRAFRRSGQNMNVTNLLRYESCFNNPDKFIELAEKYTPFMNGGLFECLDKPHPTKKGPKGGDVIIYEDGFSDRTDNPIKVPDYLFFGQDEDVDLSDQYGSKAKKYKQAAVKGLINIFNSYKFTITENTPIEQDIALDPELLGKVFENLLASYNPETKTTARKQTGSFYTPREIVGYMVDESLIAYLKNEVGWGAGEESLDTKLHELLSYDDSNPFLGNQSLQKKIIQSLDRCKILDPACGSGAFPMGILQKMVHILQKVDPENTYWQELQMDNAVKETESVFHIENKEAREQKLIEINEAFDQKVNDPDYARKLFLIENCIYGVDIQPIATQISKLRFFISLVVDQKVDKNKDNFGIRPLPNLETKFVAANTLIGIDNQGGQMTLDNPEIKTLESELIDIRHRIFSAKTPRTKRKLRGEDKEVREKMGKLLIEDGWASKTANQLAGWDPYDQNMSSGFFDPEWMFGIVDGFDVVIGNPPYIDSEMMVNTGQEDFRNYIKDKYEYTKGNWDIYIAFFEQGFKSLKTNGVLTFISPDKWITKPFGKVLREHLLQYLFIILKSGRSIFESVGVDSIVTVFQKKITESFYYFNYIDFEFVKTNEINKNIISYPYQLDIVFSEHINLLISITANHKTLSYYNVICENACATSDAYKLKEIVKDIDLDKFNKEDYLKIINTGTVDKYSSRWGIKKMTYLKDKYLYPVVDKIEFIDSFPNTYSKKSLMEKIIIKGLTLLDATIDREGVIVPGKTTLIVAEKDSVRLSYIAMIINSTLAQFYITERYSASSYNTGVNFTKDMINNLPVPDLEIKKYVVHLYVCIMEYSKKSCRQEVSAFNNILNGIVFELYFKVHMQEKQIDILQFVENDLTEVMQERDFEKLPDSEKEKIINQLHAKWTHPDSEVRNRIKLFAVRSPDILKPILESR